MSEYPIGHTIKHFDADWRVVRIIGSSITLFEDKEEVYLQTESYVELKNADGAVDFVTLTLERAPYDGPPSAIKGLEPINFDSGGAT